MTSENIYPNSSFHFTPPVLPHRSYLSGLAPLPRVLLAVKLENVFGIPEGCVFNLTLIFFLTRFVSLL